MGKRVARGFLFVFPREDDVRGARTFAVYQDLCSISVRPHQYGLIVYLFLSQAGLQVDDFQELGVVLVGGSEFIVGCAGQTHGIGDAVGEPHELDVVAWTFPVGVQGQDEPQGCCL